MWLAQEKRRCIITILSPALLIASYAQGQPDSSLSITQDVAKPASSTATAEPTCESRTVNYITHTLPQQCLTSAPSAFSTPGTVSATVTSSAADSTSSLSTGDADHEEELDADGNDLSTGAFMSFEEWKAMMLEKSGQEALEPRHRKTKETHGDYPGDDFDSLGDEGEVSLDFDAYSDKISELASSTRPSQKEKEKERQVEKVSYDEGLAQSYRSKDAGTTCKERFSYASFDAGATIKKANPGAKNPKAILVENKDSYMLLECAMKNKFVIVELSDDILVDTVVIANFEFFSSMIRHFRVSVSDRYPVKEEKWKVLGTFQARNSRNIQPFLVENPQIWAKYLRIEILTHYGNEYYCPVSLLRVHGTRMLDSWKEADPADLEVEDDSSKTVSEAAEETVVVTEVEPEEVEVAEPPRSESQVVNLEQSVFIPYWDKSYFYHQYPFDMTCADSDEKEFTSNNKEEHSQNTTAGEPQSTEPTETTSSVNAGTSSSGASTTQSTSQTITDSGRTTSPNDSGETSASTTTTESSSETVSSTTSTQDTRPATATTPETPTTITPPSLAKTASAQSSPKSRTPASTSLKPPSSRSVTVSKGQPSGSATAPRNKTGTATTSSPASAPTIQDSFFKALNKRIQALESNTTLSLQYIESQSRFLQEALARLERRQVAKVDLFLDTLNKTVLGELREARTQYDQIWQSTVIALETQREQSEREIVALSSRLGVLADEVVFQKRMAIVQSVLLLGCLVLVIFSRGGIASVAADAYYPSERFLGAVSPSRLVASSPLFPSPPQPQRGSQQHTHHHHRPSPDLPLLSVEEASPEVRPRRSPSQSQATESSSHSPSSLRHRPRRNSRATSTESTSRHRRPSTESAPAPPAGFFRAATPSSVVDMGGYDSEPAMTTPGRGGDENHHGRGGDGNGNGNGDYYATSGDDSAAGKGGVGPSYSEVLARKSERQLTPSSDVDGAEYIPISSRPPLTHSTSARKPLPALPEDPD
ncbi:uncharacterized protein F4807DRAFT_264999 [Annulohypoxylon truncatum]|uniref:uncharacterized protein n=1 Tax=Annulohypoxylon truncatum TaxID=327061 RepID=UPI002008E77C|nr:uncharacterized protein F4807DRAFT_264999 [Annulohypoxylon truncatum]KAI1213434.1 hypothetical protein F4807DRAFT_264999 [Annulohypoxylon truncatum]